MPKGNFKSDSGRSSRSSDDADDVRPEGSRRSTRSKSRVVVEVFSDDDDMPQRVDSDTEEQDDSYEENPTPMSSEENEDDDDEEEVEDDSDSEDNIRFRRSMAAQKKKGGKAKVSLRQSSRSNKFNSSMKEPSEREIGFAEVVSAKRSATTPKPPPPKKNRNSRTSTDEETDWSEDDEPDTPPERHRTKSPARHSAGKEDDKEYKIQRLLACRTETLGTWKEICGNMNTTEIHRGSRWFQDDDDKKGKDDTQREERFLVKWTGLSFIHCSWETRKDILAEIEGSQRYFTTFAQRNENGLAFSAEERMDGDYFDPAFIEVDRILSVTLPKGCKPNTAEEEDKVTNADFGIITDASNTSEFEQGKGRIFQIKWGNSSYSDVSIECERDLIIQDVEYKEKLKEFLLRSEKPSKAEFSQREIAGRTEYRRLMFFRNKNNTEERESAAKAYQAELEEEVFKSGGRLRDYQAEGVAWLVSNYVNRRSSVLADEMGLGKTIQTAAFVNILATKLYRPGPVLVVVPLSTATNWMREFQRWTSLNTVLYHGSAGDRRIIRELEMAYHVDRPKGSMSANQSFLAKCAGGGPKAAQNWMVQVVVTTPEMMIADDAGQLAHIRWECMVCDEAHRMKSSQSKIAIGLRDPKFKFNHKILLTGTPIQNEIKEFWALLNFIDPVEFASEEDFVARYGDLTVKNSIDEMHERIRPYILRRLKEDVETSVPPKEETLIEVELSLVQKQYYRAIFEKNVQFLCKKKGKAIDGPSLLNLHMELRKCCNHPFLIKGAEQTVREQQALAGEVMSEGDFLVKSSGKLILLDKLLPRLKENGHRCLIFSQFKIMLDILEDYLNARSMPFERIDGSITGNRRQQAIDRFQTLPSETCEPPFIMLLSTRAGGVGINLTAADTCIIFDSDFNPQNDLQAQSRCHRIGQTKSVKVYRLLSAKTYEMKLFHMSSLKMGLDQAVLNGFESSGGEGVMSKVEMERLLRHGAYDIFNEVKAGTAEAESRAFVEQDIDTILDRRSRTVVHENTGSQSNSKGGTFSKARFAANAEAASAEVSDDVDIDDENFWEKVVGYNPNQETASDLPEKRRRRTAANYVEVDERKINDPTHDSDDDAFSYHEGFESADSSLDGLDGKPAEVAVAPQAEWRKLHVDKLLKLLQRFGYGLWSWDVLKAEIPFWKQKGEKAIKRMSSALLLLMLLEAAREEAAITRKRAMSAAAKKRQKSAEEQNSDGPVVDNVENISQTQVDLEFQNIWAKNSTWAQFAWKDAFDLSTESLVRSDKVLHQIRRIYMPLESPRIEALFSEKLWPRLTDRGWKADTDSKDPGAVIFWHGSRPYRSIDSVLTAASSIYPELATVVEPIVLEMKSVGDQVASEKISAPSSFSSEISFSSLSEFLCRYAPMEALLDNKRRRKFGHVLKTLDACSCIWHVRNFIRKVQLSQGAQPFLDHLMAYLPHDYPSARPHPAWKVRHDAVLIQVVATHGWIEREETTKAMAFDHAVKWGRPFDETDALTQSTVVLDGLRSTAERAALFLTANHGLLDELNEFDTNLISKMYGLTKSVDNNGLPQWGVDSASLKKSFDERAYLASKAVELPSRKDLGKRIKALCPVMIEGAAKSKTTLPAPAAPHVEKTGPYGFCVLDQSDPCNVLLAEMLRPLLKINFQDNRARLLISLAYDEASKRQDEIMKILSVNKSDEMAATSKHDIEKIVQHIALVQRSAKATRQAKNLLRVILGKEPLPRRNNEDLFPSAEIKNSERKKVQKATDFTTSDRAISLGLVKAREGNASSSSKPGDFQLTALETLLLSVVASLGLPVWSPELVGHDPSSSNSRFVLSWESLCDVVENASKDWLCNAQDKLNHLRGALDRVRGAGEVSVERVNAEKTVLRAEREVKLKQIAASQSAHYSSHPEALAKKVIMLVEKLRTRMGPVGSAPATKKRATSENFLGPKVLSWLGKEVSRWGQSLQTLDAQGCVFAYSAVDFAEDATEDELEALAMFDQKACRHVFSQVAMLTRLRSVFAKYSNEDIRGRISKAVAGCTNTGEKWEKEPDWWCKSPNAVCNDFSLLENLVECGFSGVLSGTGTFRFEDSEGIVQEISIVESGLTKALIQKRANQLTRELHALEETAEVLQLVSQRRTKGSSSAAAASLPPPIVLPESAGVQTGIQAFFASGKELGFKKEVIVLSDDDVEMMSPFTPVAKRKEQGQSPEGNSPEKKIRTA